MKKYPIGFNTKAVTEVAFGEAAVAEKRTSEPRRSIVEVYFAHRGTSWPYYNDRFDLKVGDLVYVEGKLEGYQGRVIAVSYSFKIKLSDYKRVLAVADTSIYGELYFTQSHMLAFAPNVMPYEKVRAWFLPPLSEEEEFVSGETDGEGIPLDDLSKLQIDSETAARGHDIYMRNKVVYLCLEQTRGRAIVAGSEKYEVEFDYVNGCIENLTCSCYCSSVCKHEFAVLLQLKDMLEQIEKQYAKAYNGYFAALSKAEYVEKVFGGIEHGKIWVEA